MTLSASIDWLRLLRQDVAPVLAGYLALVATLVAYWRLEGRRRLASASRDRSAPVRVRPGIGGPRRTGWPALLRHVASLFVGGYLLFLLLIVVFYFVLGYEPRTFISQALGQGSILTFGITLPLYLALSAIETLLARVRRPGRGGPAGAQGS